MVEVSPAAAQSPVRIAYVTQWFKPEKVTQCMWVAEDLRSRGGVVRVLTGLPNYPEGVVHEGFDIFYPVRDEVDEFEVLRAPLYANHSNSTLKRIANYLSWAISATIAGRRMIKAADVSLVYSSPATAALPALVSKWRHRTPFVLLIQDVWPDSIFATGFLGGPVRPIAHKIVSSFCDIAYRGASEIAVISPGMIDLLVERGVPREKLHLVFNWVDEETFMPREQMPPTDGPRTIMYAGTHGAAQNLESAVDAMHEAARQRIDNVRMVFIGDGVRKPDLMKRAADGPGAHNIEFRDPVPSTEIYSHLIQAHAQLVSLQPDPLFDITMPSKVQSSLACGLPVLAAAGGDVARLIAGNDAGWVARPGDVADFVSVIRAISTAPEAELRAKSNNATNLYRNEMSRDRNGSTLFELVERSRKGT
ncbi:glycosyltransferase family 4 protein [Micrococcales bacterium 31B]|nr:glycosyltransferase family 4 protein [Micrococcales bacterium 31B]